MVDTVYSDINNYNGTIMFNIRINIIVYVYYIYIYIHTKYLDLNTYKPIFPIYSTTLALSSCSLNPSLPLLPRLVPGTEDFEGTCGSWWVGWVVG